MNDPTADRPVSEMDPAELESRRRALIAEIAAHHGGTDGAPLELLIALASVTASLRHRTAGPPKRPRPTAGAASSLKGPKGSPKSVSDLLDLL